MVSETTGRKLCKGDELSLRMLARVLGVASSHLSLREGKEEDGMPIILQHRF